jgi:hypothetical protein
VVAACNHDGEEGVDLGESVGDFAWSEGREVAGENGVGKPSVEANAPTAA